MYTVSFSDDTTEKFTSVTKAYKAIEQYWQCGNAETLAQVKADLRDIDFAIVSFCLDNSIKCFIKKD